ncbi:DNA primase [Candidatus Kaiserbacteria bacterium]|nr:DNA primase [Candidatus Kaiserbacteria bacterium]
MAGDTVEQIKERLTIQDVVAPYVKLKRAGKSLVGLCPFHKEKTPSFHVSLERGSYHCFGCGEGGDIFSFIEKAEGVDFKGALKILAEKAGVEIKYVGGKVGREASSRTERLREALARAAQFYAGQLPGTQALAYAKQRGLTAETISAWQLGYAPETWRTLLETLSAESFTLPELTAAGLIKEADGKPGTFYDRFRNRLMFPIRDGAGRVVAFTGRALSTDEPAKYLNSPETELYHKSEILFGMDKAKDAIRQRGFTLLVEGQMDALLAHQVGFANAVALSGTALTAKHLALMKRYSENLLLCLDADAAGLAASAKSAELALANGLRVKAARLPSGKDPADLISEDSQAFTACIKEAKPVADFFLAALAERERDPHRLVTLAERIVLPLIAAIKSPMEREHFVKNAARALSLSEGAVREALRRAPREPTEAGEEAAVVKKDVQSERASRELQLRAVAAAYPRTALAARVAAEYARITEAPLAPGAPESALFAAEKAFGEDPGEDAAEELLHAFEVAVIREAYQEAVGDLRRAETAADAAALRRAEAACAALSKRLAAL